MNLCPFLMRSNFHFPLLSGKEDCVNLPSFSLVLCSMIALYSHVYAFGSLKIGKHYHWFVMYIMVLQIKVYQGSYCIQCCYERSAQDITVHAYAGNHQELQINFYGHPPFSLGEHKFNIPLITVPHGIEGLQVITFIQLQHLFSQSEFFKKNSAYMMSQEISPLIRILNTSKLAIVVDITRVNISFQILPPFSISKNLRMDLFGLPIEVTLSSLLTTINLVILLLMTHLEGLSNLGRPPVI